MRRPILILPLQLVFPGEGDASFLISFYHLSHPHIKKKFREYPERTVVRFSMNFFDQSHIQWRGENEPSNNCSQGINWGYMYNKQFLKQKAGK
jgi:hypothetical protein